jgi:methionyl aminopeptidase
MTYIPANTVQDNRATGSIKLYGPEAFAGMRKAGRVAAECLDMVAGLVKPGVTTGEIDDKIYEFVAAAGAVPASPSTRLSVTASPAIANSKTATS